MTEGIVTGPGNSVWAVTVTLQGLASLSKYIKLRKHPPEQLWPFPQFWHFVSMTLCDLPNHGKRKVAAHKLRLGK